MAMAINVAAVKVERAEQESIERNFDRPTPFTLKLVAVKKATKSGTRCAAVSGPHHPPWSIYHDSKS